MQKLKKLFGEYNLTWPKLIIFSVIIGVYAGLIKVPLALKDTSFQDIAVYLEWWFFFGIFIISNCKTWHEASAKTFVFFLISQPLIYLVQVPFARLGWQLFMYYKRWAIATVLTIPGAAIAFLFKKKNWLSAVILAVPSAYMAWGAVNYAYSCSLHFPLHLLSTISCVLMAILFPLVLLDEKKHRIFNWAVFALAAAGCFFYYF